MRRWTVALRSPRGAGTRAMGQEAIAGVGRGGATCDTCNVRSRWTWRPLADAARDPRLPIRHAVRVAAEPSRSVRAVARDLADVHVRQVAVQVTVGRRLHGRPHRVDQEGEQQREDQSRIRMDGARHGLARYPTGDRAVKRKRGLAAGEPRGILGAPLSRLTLGRLPGTYQSRHRDIGICATSHDPRPLRRHAEPARRREPPPALRAAARARALRDRSGAGDGHLAVARLDAPRPAARGGLRARSAQGPAVVLRARRREPAGGGEGAARRGGPLRRPDARRRPARLAELEAERRGGLAESSRTSSSATTRRAAPGSRSPSGSPRCSGSATCSTSARATARRRARSRPTAARSPASTRTRA